MIAVYQFNYLINDKIIYTTENSDFYEMNLINQDLNYAGNPVVLKQLEQQKNIELAAFIQRHTEKTDCWHVESP